MRVWLFACVIAVLVAGVAAAVVVLSGGEGEEPAAGGEAEAAPEVAAVEAEEPPESEVATPPEPVTLRYDRLDITGAASAPGSYAFLEVTGDTATAIYNFGNLPTWSVELRIHPIDATGAPRAAFYNTVQVGDSFDYQTNRLACGFPLQGDEHRGGGDTQNVRYRVRRWLRRPLFDLARRPHSRQGCPLRVESPRWHPRSGGSAADPLRRARRRGNLSP